MPNSRNEFLFRDAKGDFNSNLKFVNSSSARKGLARNRKSLPASAPGEINRTKSNEEKDARHSLDSLGISQHQSASRGSPDRHVRFISGPRMPGQGCASDNQEITSAICLDDRTVLLRITILAAGFVIGPRGSSIKSISEKFNVRIESKTVLAGEYREFKCSGERTNLIKSIQTIKEAVNTYKRLTEGEFKGACIQSSMIICGIAFDYCPPPKSKMPHAASVVTLSPGLVSMKAERTSVASENVTYSDDSNSSCASHRYFTPKKVSNTLSSKSQVICCPITPSILETKCEAPDAIPWERRRPPFPISRERNLLDTVRHSAKRSHKIKQREILEGFNARGLLRETDYSALGCPREMNLSRTATSNSLDTESSSGSNSLNHVRNLMNDFQNVHFL